MKRSDTPSSSIGIEEFASPGFVLAVLCSDEFAPQGDESYQEREDLSGQQCVQAEVNVEDPPGEDGPKKHVARRNGIYPGRKSVLVLEKVHLAEIVVNGVFRVALSHSVDGQEIQEDQGHGERQKEYEIAIGDREDQVSEPN